MLGNPGMWWAWNVFSPVPGFILASAVTVAFLDESNKVQGNHESTKEGCKITHRFAKELQSQKIRENFD